MARAIDLNISRFAGEEPGGRSSGVLARLSRAVASHRKYLAAYEELNALTDRDLADLGVSRLNVRDLAREVAYGG